MGDRRGYSSRDDHPAGQAEGNRVYVRSMHYGDIPAVLEIERRAFPSPWSKGAFLRELQRNRYAEYVVAERDGEVVGYAGMWLFVHETHVTNIAVACEWRRRGVGGQLLVALMQMAVRRGISRITLEVRSSNEEARRFYRRYGFRTGGIRHNYYSDTDEDAVVMYCDDISGVLDDDEKV